MRSIQASRSPSSDRVVARAHAAGPLHIAIDAPQGGVLDLIEATVGLFNVAWHLTPLKSVTLEVVSGPPSPQPAAGSYLVCRRMVVDAVPDGLRATTESGASIRGHLLYDTERWTMTVPFDDPTEGEGVDVEDMLSLVLTTGWRRLGWVPLHAGAATPPAFGEGSQKRPGVIVCAGSGGGKTTFTVALIRRGWLGIGDDKLLLRSDDGEPLVAAVKHMLNLDPAVSRWFPETQPVYREPVYSYWTDKRRISMARIWPHAPTETMVPTHLFVIERVAGSGGIEALPMALPDRIGALLRQTVIPHERTFAAPLVRATTELASAVEGYTLRVHDDAYETPEPIDRVIELLS